MNALLVDAGPLIAILDADDAQHARCVAFLATEPPPLVTTWPVISEAAWMLRKTSGGVDALMTLLVRRRVTLSPLDASDLSRIATILRKYADSGVQLADASLICVAERSGLDAVFTIDRKDFLFLRKTDGSTLRIVPQ